MFTLNYFIYLPISFAVIQLTSPCKLDVQSPLPVLAKQFGSKKIIFKPLGTSVELQKGESLKAYCNTGIVYKLTEKRSDYNYGYQRNVEVGPDQTLNANTAEITCDMKNMIAIKGETSSTQNNLKIFCASQSKYDLYESKMPLTNCGSNMSYAIGVPLQTLGVGDDIKAGICYDLDKLALKFISFVTNSNSDVAVFDEVHKETNELSLSLDEEVGSFETYFQFMSEATFNATQITKRQTQNPLYKAFEFDFVSLLQDEPLNGELKSFAYIFNTMWWRQLRQHNWHYFLAALRERTKSAKYLVYMGTYGNASIPAAQGNCSTFETETISVHDNNVVVTAPAYIWAYLKPLKHADEQEFVVIAHNSPFVAKLDHNEFCSVDMCDEIEWLKNSAFGNLRRMPTLGYTFCCRPEEVAQLIDNFPLSVHAIEENESTEMNLITKA